MAIDVTTVIKQVIDDVNLAFDLFFKSFDVGMAVNGICHSRGHLCFINTSCCCFFCFASVKNRETYPPTRGKNKQLITSFKNPSCLCMLYIDVLETTKKIDLHHLSTKDILHTV
jgi:hypothetical protein